MTHKEFVTKAIDSLSEIYSLAEARSISVRLLTEFLHLSEYEYIIEPNTIIPKPDLNRLMTALEELKDYRPLQYVLGFQEFAGHKFNVSESVLIPRPETEELYRLIVSYWKEYGGYSELKILDACTGSGCLAYSLAATFPKSEVIACDKFEDVLKVAENQEIFIDEEHRQPLKNKPFFFKWDILEGPPDEKDKAQHGASLPNMEDLDILVSNPPYVCESESDFMLPNVLEYEPDEALFVPDNDPLRFYKALSEWASAFLRPGGKGYFEINEAYSREVKSLFEECGFSEVTVVEDIHNKPRIVFFTKYF